MHKNGDPLGLDLDRVAQSLRRVTVSVRTTTGRPSWRGQGASGGHGAGIVWSEDGTIVTNAHVATGDSAVITFSDGRETNARLAARDVKRDLALLRVDADVGGAVVPLPVFGDPASLRAGDVVVALGHPLGVEHALAMGVVHVAPDAARSPYIAVDIRLAPGNSGGPLADAHGRIVGVNSMIVGGLGVAVSVDAVRRLVSASAPRPVLGVELRPVRVRVPAGSSDSVGLLVLTVEPRGAAAQGGIVQGDVLLGHAGRPFRSRGDLSALLRDAGAGTALRLDVGRAGRRITCEVTLRSTGGSRRAA